MAPSEYACVFARPPRERLVAAERLARAMPAYLAGTMVQCDLHHATATRYLAFVLRTANGFHPDVIARLAFWTARTGGGGFPVGDLSEEARQRFRGELNLCDRVAKGIPGDHLPEATARILRTLGSPPPAKGPPVLAVDLDGPGREALVYRPDAKELVVAGVLAPPVGDRFPLLARARGVATPLEGSVTVTAVVPRATASAGNPAGFTLRVEGPPALQELIAARVPATAEGEKRAAPRIAVKAPVQVKPAATAPGEPPPGPAQPAPGSPAAQPAAPAVQRPTAHAAIEYATDQELQADWIENLSHGGAFVRSATPRPEGTELILDLTLPDGVKLSAQAVVTNTAANGMGIRFVLGPEQDAVLAAAMARISARPRRALVVDDVALMRQMLADALSARGFEVIAAASANEGIRRLADELMALDLLVTDLRMPGMTGEELVRFIRKTGGEAELAIVAITGRMEPETEQQLTAAGADAVLDKALGPEMIAAAADAALERKRAV